MRRIGWSCAIAAVVVSAFHVPSFGEPVDDSVVVGPLRTVVRFDFANHTFGDAGGRLPLRSTAMAGGEPRFVAREPDWAVTFPGVCSTPPERCPRAVLESDPADWLNPDIRPVRWGASVRLAPDQVSEGSNVLQKGLSAAGTQFKLQVDGRAGRPSCVVAGQDGGSHRIFVAVAAHGIADGGWHSLGCERHPTVLRLLIDGQQASETAIPAALSIVNQLPLRLGGKGVGPNNDQFHGTMDDVFVEIG